MERTAASTSSTERPPCVLAGVVVGAHGLRGEIRVRCFGEPGDFETIGRLYAAEREDGSDGQEYSVTRVAKGRRAELRITLRDVDDRETAEGLRGRQIFVDIDDLVPTDDDEYYGYQLIGCRVEGEDGSEIGVVRDIESTGAADVLVVADANGREQLVPTVREFVRDVDLDARRIVIEVIPGLLIDD